MDDDVEIDVPVDGDPGIFASLALPGNPLAGAVSAGNHLLWKAKDMEDDPIWASIQPQLGISGTRYSLSGANSEEQRKAAVHAYQASESLSGLARGMPAEMMWYSGQSLDRGTNDYFGLTEISGAPITVKQYSGETASVLLSTAKKVQKAAEDTREDASMIAERLLRSSWIELSESEDDYADMQKVLVQSLKTLDTDVETFDAEVSETEVTALRAEVASLKEQLRQAKKTINESPVITDTQVEAYSKNVSKYAKKIAELNKKLREWEKSEARLVEKIRKLEDDLRLKSKDLNHAIERNKDLSDRFNEFRLESKRKLKEVREKNVNRIAEAAGEPDDDQVAELTRLLEDCEAMLERMGKEREIKLKIAETERKLKEVKKHLEDQKKRGRQKDANLEELRAENATLETVIIKDKNQLKEGQQQRAQLEQENTRLRDGLEAIAEENDKGNAVSEELVKRLVEENAESRSQRDLNVNTRPERVRQRRDKEKDKVDDLKINKLSAKVKELQQIEANELQGARAAAPGIPSIILVSPKQEGIAITPTTKQQAIDAVFRLQVPLRTTELTERTKVGKHPNRIAIWSFQMDSQPQDKGFEVLLGSTYNGKVILQDAKAPLGADRFDAGNDSAPRLFTSGRSAMRLEFLAPSRFEDAEDVSEQKLIQKGPNVLLGFAVFVRIKMKEKGKKPVYLFANSATQDLPGSADLKKDSFEPSRWILQIGPTGANTPTPGPLSQPSVVFHGMDNEEQVSVYTPGKWKSARTVFTRVYLTGGGNILDQWNQRIKKEVSNTEDERGKLYSEVSADLREWLKSKAVIKNIAFVVDTAGSRVPSPMSKIKSRFMVGDDDGAWKKQESTKTVTNWW